MGFDTIKINLVLDDVGKEEELQKKVGPKSKPFSELGRMQQRRVTQEAYDSVKELARVREADVVTMTGYMLKR